MSKESIMIDLPEELIEELKKYEMIFGTDTTSSTILEVLKKYLALNEIYGFPKTSKQPQEDVCLENSSASSMYDADDEPCEVLTSFLEP